uniref:Uncharacterized protein n=1 Tax=Glossina austeni TaxID=7395 RepID=A0A1A9VHC8_GLOAU
MPAMSDTGRILPAPLTLIQINGLLTQKDIQLFLLCSTFVYILFHLTVDDQDNVSGHFRPLFLRKFETLLQIKTWLICSHLAVKVFKKIPVEIHALWSDLTIDEVDYAHRRLKSIDLFSFYLCFLNLTLTCYVRHIIIGQLKHTRHTRCLIASTTQYSKSGLIKCIFTSVIQTRSEPDIGGWTVCSIIHQNTNIFETICDLLSILASQDCPEENPYRRMRERVASLYSVCIEYANLVGIILKTNSRISTKKFIDHVKSETSTTEIDRDFYVERKQKFKCC